MAEVILQQVFAMVSGMVSQDTNATISGGATNETTSAAAKPATPTDLSSLLMLLFSFSALRDWLKLIIIGGFFETARRLAFSAYYKVINSFFITVYFEEEDSSYDWMMVWLSKRPSWAQARELQVSTRTFGLNSNAVMIPGDEDDASAVLNGSSTKRLAYLPSTSSTYSIWYKRRWMTVTRVIKQGGYYGRTEETLQISIMTRHHKFLNELLLEAKKEYMAAQEHTISIYVSDSSNNWRHVASRPKRPLHSIVLDPGIKDLLVDDAQDFLESKSWYSARGIPFRRGYLLYGAPGSGKTSIIHSMAGELGLDVYIISLSRAGLDDTALSELISELPEKCIALMEDIDAAFSQTMNRDAPAPINDDPNRPPPPPNGQGGPPPSTTSRISLSGLLNALDGVGAQEGRILYATTNKYTALDPALCRPGRMDIHVEFKLASKYQAGELYRCFYLPNNEEKSKGTEKAEKESTDSGYNSDVEPQALDNDTASETSEASEKTPSVVEKPVFFGNSHRKRAPRLSQSQIEKLAKKFVDAIPEREFSMASLQGYLMAYKTRPFEAVKDAPAWVESERAERAKKAAAPAVVAAPTVTAESGQSTEVAAPTTEIIVTAT